MLALKLQSMDPFLHVIGGQSDICFAVLIDQKLLLVRRENVRVEFPMKSSETLEDANLQNVNIFIPKAPFLCHRNLKP